MLVDSATIYVRSGRGGDGCVSFRREKYVAKGGPDGGDGGDGGSVVLLASREVDTLLDFAGRHHWIAESGQPGAGKQLQGKSANDLVIELPPGTQVFDADTDELIVDLDELDMEYVVAPGGKGGKGNVRFATAINQVPRESTPGGEPEEHNLRLDLKLIADIGLVGLPNAGKSTLLSRLTRARPKIADYPFTTLEPQLGIAELDPERRLVIADIPGLIEHAHEGQGLGDRFLRHIERTKLLVHVVEPEPTDGSDPAENYRIIRNELASFSKTLADKLEVIVLSKLDTLGGQEDFDATAKAAKELIAPSLGADLIAISSVSNHGLRELLERCWSMLGKQAQRREGWRENVKDD